MRKLMWLLPAAALWIASPAPAQGPFGRPSGPRLGPHFPGDPGVGDPFGRRPGIPGLPGQFDPFGRPPNIPGMPGQPDPFAPPRPPWQNFDPDNPRGRRGLPGRPGQNFGPGRFPGVNLPGRPVPPPRDLGPLMPPVIPPPDDKDRDKHNGLGVMPFIPHVVVPEFHEPFRPPPVREFPSASGRAVGGGLLAAIAAALSGLFRRNKDKDST